MPDVKPSRKRNWAIAGVLLAVLVIGLGVFLAPTLIIGIKMNKYSTTEKCRAAIASGDTDPIAFENLAAFQMADRHDNEAIQTLRQCLKVNPDDRFAKYTLGLTLADNHQGDEALAIDKELAQTNDRWGKAARRHLRHNHIPGY